MATFGKTRVFRDVDTIAPGKKFARVLEERLASCAALLAVIGPDWLRAESRGRRRLDDPDDYVRREIATAIEREVPVIPVLVGGATVPSPNQLPAPLAPLTSYQAAVIHELHFHDDVDLLIKELEEIAGTPGLRSLRPRQVSGDRPWLCRDPDWFADRPEPVWPTLSIDWPPEAVAAARDGGDNSISSALAARLERTLERLWHAFGVIVPGVCMRQGPNGEYVVRVAGNIAGRGAVGPDPLEAPVRDLEAAILDEPKAVVGHQEVASLLTALGTDVLDAVLAERGALSELVLVCRALLAEHVPITSLATIVGGFQRLRPTGTPLVDIVEELRRSAEIRPLLPGNDDRHSFVTLSPAFERVFVGWLNRTWDQPVLTVPADAAMSFLDAVDEAVAELSGHVAVVVERAPIRPFVRRLIDVKYPRLWVLARQELRVELEERAAGRIELP